MDTWVQLPEAHVGQGSLLQWTVSCGRLAGMHPLEALAFSSWHTTCLRRNPPPHVLEHLNWNLKNKKTKIQILIKKSCLIEFNSIEFSWEGHLHTMPQDPVLHWLRDVWLCSMVAEWEMGHSPHAGSEHFCSPEGFSAGLHNSSGALLPLPVNWQSTTLNDVPCNSNSIQFNSIKGNSIQFRNSRIPIKVNQSK